MSSKLSGVSPVKWDNMLTTSEDGPLELIPQNSSRIVPLTRTQSVANISGGFGRIEVQRTERKHKKDSAQDPTSSVGPILVARKPRRVNTHMRGETDSTLVKTHSFYKSIGEESASVTPSSSFKPTEPTIETDRPFTKQRRTHMKKQMSAPDIQKIQAKPKQSTPLSANPIQNNEASPLLSRKEATKLLKLQAKQSEKEAHINKIIRALKLLGKKRVVFKIENEQMCSAKKASHQEQIEAALLLFKDMDKALDLKIYAIPDNQKILTELYHFLNHLSKRTWLRELLKSDDKFQLENLNANPLRAVFNQTLLRLRIGLAKETVIGTKNLLEQLHEPLDLLCRHLGTDYSAKIEGNYSLSVKDKFLDRGEHSFVTKVSTVFDSYEELMSLTPEELELQMADLNNLIVNKIQSPLKPRSKNIYDMLEDILENLSLRLQLLGLISKDDRRGRLEAFKDAWPTGDAAIGLRVRYKKVLKLISNLSTEVAYNSRLMKATQQIENIVQDVEDQLKDEVFETKKSARKSFNSLIKSNFASHVAKQIEHSFDSALRDLNPAELAKLDAYLVSRFAIIELDIKKAEKIEKHSFETVHMHLISTYANSLL